MCDHNQDSIEICSAQQVRLIKNYYIQKADTLKHVCQQVLTDSCSHAGSHVDNTTLLILYQAVLLEICICFECQTKSKAVSRMFYYNYSSLKENVCIFTCALFENLKSCFVSIVLNIQQLLLSQIILSFSVQINQVVLTMHS